MFKQHVGDLTYELIELTFQAKLKVIQNVPMRAKNYNFWWCSIVAQSISVTTLALFKVDLKQSSNVIMLKNLFNVNDYYGAKQARDGRESLSLPRAPLR